jgi:hypothetical protein
VYFSPVRRSGFLFGDNRKRGRAKLLKKCFKVLISFEHRPTAGVSNPSGKCVNRSNRTSDDRIVAEDYWWHTRQNFELNSPADLGLWIIRPSSDFFPQSPGEKKIGIVRSLFWRETTSVSWSLIVWHCAPLVECWERPENFALVGPRRVRDADGTAASPL